MKKIIIISVFLISFLMLFSPVLPAYAKDCLPNGSPPLGETVCNPAHGLFIDLPDNTFKGIFAFIVQALLGVAGAISMLFIVIGGFRYITSRGNDEQAEAGKKTLTNAIIGLVIVILSYTIVAVVINALNNKV